MEALRSTVIATSIFARFLRRFTSRRVQVFWIPFFLLGSNLLVRPILASDALDQSCDARPDDSTRVAELKRSIMAGPTVAAYDALGSLYASNHQNECAVSAFTSALKLNPRSKEAKYDLALALRLGDKLEEAQLLLQSMARDYPDFAPAHEARAEILLGLKRPDEAREEFETALRLDERLASASEGLVQLSLSLKHPQAAVYWAQRALSLGPDPLDKYRLQLALGTAEGEAGDFNSAAEILSKLAVSDPNQSDPHFNLAIVYAHLQRYPEAAGEFERVLQLDGNNDAARLAMAQMDLMANQPSDALPFALEYTRRQPNNPEGFSTLAQAYRAMSRFPEAVAAYKRSLELGSGSYDALFGLGMCQLQSSQDSDALESFEAAERMDPSQPAVHYQIFKLLSADRSQDNQSHAQRELAAFKDLNSRDGQSARSSLLGAQANTDLDKGDPKAAADLYRQALQLDPTDAKNHYNLSLALARLGDREEEARELRAAIALDPKMGKAFNRLGLYELQHGNYEEAVNDFKKVLENDPGSTDAQVNLATVYAKMGRNAEAESLYREATASAPDSVPAQLNLGLILAGQGKLQEAIVPLAAATRLAPSNPEPFTLLGIVYGKLGQPSQSIGFLKQALSLNPNSANAHLNLGIALADGYDLSGAAAQFSEAGRLAPSAAIVHYNIGRVAFDMGDLEKAREELQRACDLQQGYMGAMQLLAQVDLHENHPEQALSRLQQIVALHPDNSDAEYLLGQALMDLGSKPEAVTQWQHALKYSPDDVRLYWVLSHQLPASDPHRRLYLERLQAIQGSEREADQAKTLANLAISAANSHEWTEAVAKMNDAVKVCGNCSLQGSLEQKLGLIFAQQGELEKAEQALRRSVEIDPKESKVVEELAIVENLQKGR